jgi:hypothetical protein
MSIDHSTRVRTKATRNAWNRNRLCILCGKSESVRKDNTANTCRSCAARKNGAGGLATREKNRLKAVCIRCGQEFFTHKSANHYRGQKFCSLLCRRACSSLVTRYCKRCGAAFTVYKGVLSGKTNASGNFCSRPCYEKWLCHPERVTGRGSRWKAIASEVKRRQPFCALCGALHNLEIHHIVPFRMTRDNSLTNLITLCKKHHKVVETQVNEAISRGSQPEDIALVFGSLLRMGQLPALCTFKTTGANL